MTFGHLIETGMTPEAAVGVLSAPRWAMAQALDDLDHRHGGVEVYLTGPAGMAAADLEIRRERLVGPGG